MLFSIKTDTNNLTPLVAMINTAYRTDVGAGRWTTESHLVAGDRISAEQLAALIQSSNTHIMLMHSEEVLMGCIAITEYDASIQLGTYAVVADKHGQGYGGMLLEQAQQWARLTLSKTKPLEVVVLSQNTALVDFYLKRGFVDTAKRLAYPVEAGVGSPRLTDLTLSVLHKVDF